MPGAERHSSFNQCLGPPSVQMSGLWRHNEMGPPSVQMSGLCRHNERYEHKDASRQAAIVIRSQIVYQ